MGRAPRPFIPGAIYHLTAHGTDDRAIFIDDVDRQSFALRLLRVAPREDWWFYAVCLLVTHYHLVVEPLRQVSSGMRVLNGARSRSFNARHHRRGALFESRYVDRIVRDEAHLANAITYVEYNAVSAGIVEDLAARLKSV
jgi:REP element-mobilizing transposase RayT